MVLTEDNTLRASFPLFLVLVLLISLFLLPTAFVITYDHQTLLDISRHVQEESLFEFFQINNHALTMMSG